MNIVKIFHFLNFLVITLEVGNSNTSHVITFQSDFKFIYLVKTGKSRSCSENINLIIILQAEQQD
jgi:hypothetical protein